MAPALARLSPARGTASADAVAKAARNRRARPAGHGNEPGAKALARLVCKRRLARNGLSFGRDRCAIARTNSRKRSPTTKSSHRSLITNAMPCRSRCSTTGSNPIGTILFGATLWSLARDDPRLRGRRRIHQFLRQLVHAGFRRFSSARHGGLRNPFPGGLRRRRGRSMATATRFARSMPSCARTSACRAPRISPSRPGESCWPTSTSGGWSTSSAICRSARHHFTKSAIASTIDGSTASEGSV